MSTTKRKPKKNMFPSSPFYPKFFQKEKSILKSKDQSKAVKTFDEIFLGRDFGTGLKMGYVTS
jgi:hypothetical protein